MTTYLTYQLIGKQIRGFSSLPVNITPILICFNFEFAVNMYHEYILERKHDPKGNLSPKIVILTAKPKKY